jgi:ATP-dependent helicase HepA
MVLNALRWQNPQHKAVILVPDRLVLQWRDECWSRAHTHASVVGDKADEKSDPWVRIVRPQSIQSNEFPLDPVNFDLLIVDEPQMMPGDVMEAVSRTAPDFRQLLILSATPGLGDPHKRRRLLGILEPERMGIAALAQRDFLVELARLEEQALPKAQTGESSLLYRSFSTERRISRATRAEWGRLPSCQTI